jgi:hypothetical protein
VSANLRPKPRPASPAHQLSEELCLDIPGTWIPIDLRLLDPELFRHLSLKACFVEDFVFGPGNRSPMPVLSQDGLTVLIKLSESVGPLSTKISRMTDVGTMCSCRRFLQHRWLYSAAVRNDLLAIRRAASLDLKWVVSWRRRVSVALRINSPTAGLKALSVKQSA